MMNTPPMLIEPVAPPLRVDECGAVRVGKTRVTLSTLIDFYNMGRSPEELAEDFSSLSLAEVYAAIAYYLEHRQETDAYLEKVERECEAMKKEIESRPESIRMRQLLIERMRQRKENSASVSRG